MKTNRKSLFKTVDFATPGLITGLYPELLGVPLLNDRDNRSDVFWKKDRDIIDRINRHIGYCLQAPPRSLGQHPSKKDNRLLFKTNGLKPVNQNFV